MALLAVIFAGKGVAALQEFGVLRIDPVDFPGGSSAGHLSERAGVDLAMLRRAAGAGGLRLYLVQCAEKHNRQIISSSDRGQERQRIRDTWADRD